MIYEHWQMTYNVRDTGPSVHPEGRDMEPPPGDGWEVVSQSGPVNGILYVTWRRPKTGGRRPLTEAT